MAEILGVITSILTLCAAVTEVVSRVSELYRAPTEIKTLQEQVQLFRNVIQTLEATSEVSKENIVYCALCRARNIIKELHQVITVKLIRQGDKSGRVRRRAWFRNKRSIIVLRNDLKDAQETLLGALSVDLLGSTRRVESNLTSISQQSTKNHLTSLRNGQRLEHIENVLNPWQPAHTTLQALSTTLGSSNVDAESREAAPSMLRPSVGTSYNLLGSSSFHDTYAANIPGENMCALGLPQIPPQSLDNRLVQRAVPASPFELGASFRPETYTVLDVVPTLFGYDHREVAVTEFTRLNQCAMFYRKAPRKWTRLTASITISFESKYWNLERKISGNSAKVLTTRTSDKLPTSLTVALETFLRSCQELKQDSHLSVFLGNSSDLETSEIASKLAIKFVKPLFQAESYLQQITRALRYWDCPRYLEKELIEQPISRQFPDHFFITNLRSRWVLEVRFGSDKSQIDLQIYALQVLHCLHGAAGIVPFVGLVLGDDSHTISAFLCELPAKGILTNVVLDALKSGQPISWDRRAKWCRQIIQAVAVVHSKGFVVGCLVDTRLFGIAVDGDDNAMLCRFRKSFVYDNLRPGVLPPEYRGTVPDSGSTTALPQTDIYQLGLLLWGFATNTPVQFCSEFSRNADCTTKAGTICAEPHADPIQLPSLDEDTPQHLKEIIAACRSESPGERPPAWKLLEMFPCTAEDKRSLSKAVGNGVIPNPSSHQDISVERGTVQGHVSHRTSIEPGPRSGCTPNHLPCLEEYLERYGTIIFCDHCGARTNPRYFHCNMCLSSDYDICPRCFFQGKHCLEGDHYLLEYSEGHKEARYHTSIKETGQRDFVTV